MSPLTSPQKELVNMAAKSIIPAGIIILACHSISIGYFPYKVSITDPIIITMTLCFGFVYFTYVTCMIFVCATIETITRKCLAPTLVRLVNKIKKKNLKLYNPPIKMEWYYHPVSALGALLIIITSELNITRLITLILVSFVFYALASMIVAVNEKCLTPIIIRPGETPESTISILNNLKFLRMILIIIFIGSPIFLFQTDVPKILLEKAMIVAQVRKERSIVYVKPPYNKMIPQELRFDDNLSPTGYAAFKGIDILSRNIGEDVFLEVKTDQITKRLTIPASHINIPQIIHINH